MTFRLGGVAILCFLSASAFGDTIVGAGFGSSGPAYWNNSSRDAATPSTCYNIGCILTGVTGTNSTVDTNQLSWATDASGIPTDMFFSSSGGQYNISVLQNSTLNGITFGWYDVATQTKHALYSSPENSACATTGSPDCIAPPSGMPPTSLTFGTDFGFYITVDYHNGIIDSYFMQTSLNTTDGVIANQAQAQHFAVFQKDGAYYLGMEDSIFWQPAAPNARLLSSSVGLDAVEKNGDFQDFLVRLQPIPEPSTVGFLLLGFGGLIGLARRRN